MQTPDRHRALSDAFAEWLELPPDARSALLDRFRETDAALADELDALIAAEALSGDFLEEPIGDRLPLQMRDAGASKEAPLQEDSMIGRRLGAYRIISTIGYGGMGAVYLAVRADDQFEQRVAIKVIRAGLDPRAAASFRRERQILANLSHPYIAHLIDGGETEAGEPYLVMEYVEGGPITRHCDEASLDVRQRLQLFLRVCEAVRFAHQHLVVHRDIKPANILVTGDGVPKLLDFGIARMMQAADAAAEPSARTARLLTPDYASPEQVRGEPVTTATDVYSLGVVLYELLVRSRPYRHVESTSDVYAILDAIRREDPQRPTDAVKGRRDALPLDTEIDAILLKALRKLPGERYSSAEQFAEDLQRYLDGRPIRAQAASAPYRMRKFVVRHWAGVAATVVGAISLVVATLISRQQAAIATAERARAEQRFNDVRQLANAFVFEFDRSIQALPGATAARRLAIARGLEYLERLAKDADEAPLLRELAAGYQRIAEVQGNPFFANLGDVEGAGKSYRRAIELTERLTKIGGATDSDRAAFAAAIQGQADLMWSEGDFEGALRGYQRALQMNHDLSASKPDDPDPAYAGARSAYYSGQALTKLGRFDEALENYRAALGGYETITARHPARVEFQRGVAVAATKVGDCLGRAGDWAGARTQYERAVTLIEKLLNTAPEAPTIGRLRGFFLDRLAQALVEVGDLSGAYHHAVRAVDQAEKLARVDAGDRQARRDRAAYRSWLGVIAFLLGRLAEAERVLAMAEAEFDDLARTGSVSVDQRSERGVTLRWAGDVSRRAGRVDEAYERYQSALAQLEPGPRDLEYEAELAVLLMRLGETPRVSHGPQPPDLPGRRALLTRSLELWRSAESRGVRPSRLQPGGSAAVEAMIRGLAP